jgi:hypothetical protein
MEEHRIPAPIMTIMHVPADGHKKRDLVHPRLQVVRKAGDASFSKGGHHRGTNSSISNSTCQNLELVYCSQRLGRRVGRDSSTCSLRVPRRWPTSYCEFEKPTPSKLRD